MVACRLDNILSGLHRRRLVKILSLIATVCVATAIVGCATLPPPSGPSPYAQSVAPITKRNMNRVPHCMQVAAEASKRVQQQNTGSQVAGAVIGGVLGGLAGAAISTPTRAYVGRPRLYVNPYSGHLYARRSIVAVPGHNLTGIGVAGGAAAGAALMGGAQQSPQQAYDTAYLQCMQWR